MQSPSAAQGLDRQPTKGVKRLSRYHPYTHDPRGKYGPAGQHDPQSSSRPHSCSLTSLLYATLPCTLPTPHHEEQSSFLEKPLGSEPAPPFECEAPVEWTDTDRSEYARCLIDSAVETLSAKWYMTSLRDFPKVLQFMRNPDGTISLPKSLQQAANGIAHMEDVGPRYPYQSTHEHMPLRQFLHEVLRRSRTSCTVLQVALCYVEAVAVKLPRVMDDEVRRVEQYNVAALMADPTIPIASVATTVTMLPPGIGDTDPTVPAGQLTPPLPSPLLCPRRTFLAALLLASKFMQDRSYSNKAWGKLTGLSPREVSRCERALAEALEWRLWVGHMELLPRGFKDDGAPVVSGDATFSTEPVEPAASEPVIAAIEEHIRRTMDMEGSGAHRRAARARSLPDIASIPRRNLAALQASARTQTWVNTLPQNLPSIPSMLPAGAKTPVIDPTPLPPPLTATLVDHFPISGSPPESLVHTQSSVESFATFSEVSTPPDTQDIPAPPAVFMKTGMAMENHGMQLAMLGLGVDAGIPAILPEIPLVDYVGGAGGRY